MNKREFLRLGLIGLGGVIAAPAMANNVMRKRLITGAKDFKLPDLRYNYDALHPFMDAETVSTLYKKHAGYLQHLNTTLADEGLKGKTLREIFLRVTDYPETVRINGGGFFNYRIFWKALSPKGGAIPNGILREALIRDFGSLENFRSEFSGVAGSVEGNGWAWLILQNGKLKITSTKGQDNPVMNVAAEQGRPLLCLNMNAEAISPVCHNNSSSYIEKFWNVVNWDFVSKKYSRFRTA